MTLWNNFLTNSGQPLHKWTHYFPIYDQWLAPRQNTPELFMEIGVWHGGSMRMWRNHFSARTHIIGIDISPDCKRFEEPGIDIRIGDQHDVGFLQSILDEFGCPTIILDDGSHHMKDIQATFDFFYPKMSENALYMVEDLHTAYWPAYGGGLRAPKSFIEFSKHCVDLLNASHSGGNLDPSDVFTRGTHGIHFYDSLVIFERGSTKWRESLMTGNFVPPDGAHIRHRT